MNVDSIGERLRAAGIFKTVAASLTLADALNDGRARYPAAFVVVPSDRAEPGRTIGRQRQRVTSRVPIVIGVKAAGPDINGARDEVGALKLAVIDCLAGWKPDDADTALDYLSADLRQIADGMVWIEVAFQCAWYLTIATPDAPASAAG